MGTTIRIIMLRAVNVGGTAKLPMAELRELAAELGATDVQTYIRSGNLVCVPPGVPEEFDRALEKAIKTKYGFSREAISRSPAELRAALEAHPFEVVEPKYSYIAFMNEAPTSEAIAKASTYQRGDDQWEIIGRDWHIRYAHGAGKPGMKAASIARALNVPTTARNLNTVRKLISLAG